MSSPATTDETASSGWPPGLVDAYRDHWVDLTRLAFLMTRRQAVAEELVQDAFVAARPRWSGVDNPGGYLRACVVNAVRDWSQHQAVVRRNPAAGPPPSAP